MLTLRQLSYFVAAAEHQGTAQAARALNVSQPSVSVAIKQLEDHIGQPLFVRRHAQGLTLTQEGSEKLAEARSILSRVNAWAVSPTSSTGRQTWVDVGCFSTLGPVHMPAILKKFQALYPRVRVRLREGDIEELHRLVDSGLIEVALMYNLDLGRTGNVEVVAELKPHVIVPAEHPLASCGTVSLKEVAKYPLMLINLRHSRDYFLGLFRTKNLTPVLGMEAQSIEMLRGLVANGLGISILTTRSKLSDSSDGQPLTVLEIQDNVAPQQVVVVTPIQFPLTWMASAFIAVVREYFSTQPKMFDADERGGTRRASRRRPLEHPDRSRRPG